MEKEGARLFQQETNPREHGWNIVELETRRQLRHKVDELIRLSSSSTVTTGEIQQQLHLGAAAFGPQLAAQLARSLQCDDPQKRQHIVWLLTLLDDKETIPLLHRISHNEKLSRSIRLSASLALAGMGATQEMTGNHKSTPLYAIG